MNIYYADKLASLGAIFSSDALVLEPDCLYVEGRRYPIVDDVIILLDLEQYPPSLHHRVGISPGGEIPTPKAFAEDIQFTFGDEWQTFPQVLPEHQSEFQQYFDLIDLESLHDARVCDLGCGIGRWSYFLKDKCRELMLVDFSEAIFVARENLRDCSHALFFMGDLKRLPFRPDFADFLFSLGVLHHLPTDALDEVRALQPYAPTIMIYLYYSLDNRPTYFRGMLAMVSGVRLLVSRIRNPLFRTFFTLFGAIFLYLPLVVLGHLLSPLGLARHVPLYEAYKGKSIGRIRQDVYDRFFTRIEQRFSRKQIATLQDCYSQVVISERWPYWHFLCRR